MYCTVLYATATGKIMSVCARGVGKTLEQTPRALPRRSAHVIGSPRRDGSRHGGSDEVGRWDADVYDIETASLGIICTTSGSIKASV